MVHALRPAGRFYAAFYRWSCSTVRASHCSRSLRRRLSLPETLRAGLAYSTTRPLLRDNAATSAAHDESASAGQETASPDPVSMKTAMRTLMRHVPSTVTVITVHATHPDTAEPVPVGSAISSLTTVTLDPPHVSFNLKTPSRTLDAIHKAGGRFRVSFLDSSAAAVELASNFTQGNSLEILNQRKSMFWFESASSASEEFLPPKIMNRCVLASITCQLLQAARVADHVIAVASVVDFTSREKLSPALLYHEGSFKSYTDSELNNHNLFDGRGKRSGLDVYYSYPLFPGEAEKEDYISRAKEYVIRNRETFCGIHSSKTSEILEKGWGMIPGTFGLNIPLLVDQCKVELGLRPDLQAARKNASVVYRFHGQLSPNEIITIANRAKMLVKSDPTVADLSARSFLDLLDVHSVATNLLASDILVPLRKDGLVAPFELRSLESPDASDPELGCNTLPRVTLSHLEQIEHRLLEFFKSTPYERTRFLQSDALERVVGVKSDHAAMYLRQIRARITTEAYPEQFSSPTIDIRGHLSPEEGRIVVARIVKALTLRPPPIIKAAFSSPKAESLRRLGIHPMVTGIDVDFLWEKMKFMMERAKKWRQYVDAANEMLDSVLEKGSIDLEQARSRARKLVESHTLKVMQWSTKDQIAAMGLRYPMATVHQKGSEVPVHQMAHTLIAQALKARRQDDSITSDEKAAITDLLRPKTSKATSSLQATGSVGNHSPNTTPASGTDGNGQTISPEATLQNLTAGAPSHWATSDVVPTTEASTNPGPGAQPGSKHSSKWEKRKVWQQSGPIDPERR